MVTEQQIEQIQTIAGVDRQTAELIAIEHDAQEQIQRQPAGRQQLQQPSLADLPWMNCPPSCEEAIPVPEISLVTELPDYPMNGLPSYGCQQCNGAGFYKLHVPVGHPDFARLFPCRCKLAEREARDTAALHELDQQLQRYRSCRLETFDLDRPLAGVLHWQGHTISEEQQRAALQEALRIATSYSERPRGWLYLYGPPGSGKTRLAASIANEFRNRRMRASYGRVQAILNWLKAGFNEQSAAAFDQRLQALERIPLLLIDDLGTEYGTAWERTVFENLINERYNRELPTVLTSNNWRDELPTLIADRIAEMAQVVWLTVSSHRRVRSLQASGEPDAALLNPWDRGEGEG